MDKIKIEYLLRGFRNYLTIEIELEEEAEDEYMAEILAGYRGWTDGKTYVFVRDVSEFKYISRNGIAR